MRYREPARPSQALTGRGGGAAPLPVFFIAYESHVCVCAPSPLLLLHSFLACTKSTQYECACGFKSAAAHSRPSKGGACASACLFAPRVL